MRQTPGATRRARGLRRELTVAEARFWEMVRDRRLDGLKFRRETPLVGLTVDFYCAELKLVVELDGGLHRLREAEDAERDLRLMRAGFFVLRSSNTGFLDNPNALMGEIRKRASALGVVPSSVMLRMPPSPPRGEG
ncbi:MAG: DUF559 domain-containing protein [Brevundimonas sp.]|nr:MAG: DUF559 domain-containing protein [Brevundimonas sp.]